MHISAPDLFHIYVLFYVEKILNCAKNVEKMWPLKRQSCKKFFAGKAYRASHGFGQAKFAYGISVLGSSQFALLPQLSLKMMHGLKVVKIDLKIIIWLS